MDILRLDELFKVMQNYGITVEKCVERLEIISQSLLGPETCAETVIPNSKTDLEIFEPNGGKSEKVNFHLIEKIHII